MGGYGYTRATATRGGVGRVLLDDGGCSSRYADVVDG